MASESTPTETGRRVTTQGQPSDASVLKLRREGRSFAGIAKALGYERASYANEAFNRALRELPSDEQAVVRAEENVRLDTLESRLRARTDLDVEDVDRRLRTIGRLRQALMAN